MIDLITSFHFPLSHIIMSGQNSWERSRDIEMAVINELISPTSSILETGNYLQQPSEKFKFP